MSVGGKSINNLRLNGPKKKKEKKSYQQCSANLSISRKVWIVDLTYER